MQRNLDLIRDILLFLEKQSGNVQFYQIADALHVPAETLHYHLILMKESHLIILLGGISVLTPTSRKYESVFIRRITAEGYDYLDSIRSKDTWSKVKSTAVTAGKTAGIAVIQETMKKLLS